MSFMLKLSFLFVDFLNNLFMIFYWLFNSHFSLNIIQFYLVYLSMNWSQLLSNVFKVFF